MMAEPAFMDGMPPNLSELLSRAAQRHGSRPALTGGDRTLSYAETDQLVTALAASLAHLGVGQGDRVAIHLPNCPQFVLSYFAVARAGAMAVPINTLLAEDEIAFILEDAGACVLITAEPLASASLPAFEQSQNTKYLVVSGQSGIPGAVSFDQLLTPPPAPPDFPEVASDGVAVIKYTSGTTGRPKGAMLTHRNLIFDARSCEQAILVGPDDVFITVLPLFHCFGATVCMVLPVLVGAHSILLPRFTGASCLGAIQAHQATVFAGVPAMFGLMLRASAEADFDIRSLRICVSGGAPITREVFLGFEQRFGVAMLEGYGPTEASPVVSVNPLQGPRKLGSVGPPLPGVEVSIRGEDRRELPVGEIGEICVRGPNVMAGYWRNPEATAEAIVDGWLYTGDMGRMDEDGYLYISGRKKELIIVGGMNVYPREIEEVIEQIPAVAEVAVIGVPDTLRGETPVAFVVAKPEQTVTETDVVNYCRERLAAYKVPSRVVFRDQFARNATGKIIKQVLAELV